MKTVGHWYTIVALLVFTFCVPVLGKTPAAWCLSAISYVVHSAPRLAGGR
jgi:hypothetical protein